MRPNFNTSHLGKIASYLDSKGYEIGNMSGTEDNIFSIEVKEPGGESYLGVYKLEGEEVKEIERKPR